MRRSLFLVGAVGCAEARLPASETLPAEGVRTVVIDVERGDVVVSGTQPTEFVVSSEAWASAATQGQAEAAAGGVEFGARVVGDRLSVTGRSGGPRAGVDVVIEGPPGVDVDAWLSGGRASMRDLDGDLVVTSDGFDGTGLTGSVDLVSDGSVSLDADPALDTHLKLDVHGDVRLGLPYGAPIDLVAFPDPDYAVEVADLGFDSVSVAPDFVDARTGTGRVTVEVVVRSGSFTLGLPAADLPGR
ncbi:MAG: hypothetical protein ABMA64_11490 [Myxococcota bacterium]